MRLRGPLCSVRSVALAVVLLGPVTRGWCGDHDAPEAADELLGRWTIVEGVNQGAPVPAARLDGSSVRVTPDTILAHDSEAKEMYRATYQLDRSAKPHRIDMMPDAADGRSGGKVRGIFKETEEGWTLCYALPGARRPETFESPPGSRILLFKLGRPPKGE